MAVARIDKDSCYANEDCVRAMPDLFRIGDDGLAEFTPPSHGPAARDQLLEAARACPTQAISVDDDNGSVDE